MARAAVVDLDGTVLRGETLIPGARDAMADIRAATERVLFVTNNPTVPPGAYAARLRGLGVEATAAEIVTAGAATVAYLRANHADAAVYPIAGEPVVAQLRDGDVSLTDDPAAADAVVAGYDESFGYADLVAALRALDGREGVAFVGTDPDRAIPSEDGPIPGSGAIVRAVAGVTGREPDVVLGKPSRETAEIVLERLGVPASECIVVGDNPATDIAFGESVGMTTVRVRTGVADADGPEPDHVVASLADAVSLFEASHGPSDDSQE